MIDKRRKLSEEQREAIRCSTLSNSKLAEQYNVSNSTIYYIKRPDKYAVCLNQNRENMKHYEKRTPEEMRKYMAELRKRKKNL